MNLNFLYFSVCLQSVKFFFQNLVAMGTLFQLYSALLNSVTQNTLRTQIPKVFCIGPNYCNFFYFCLNLVAMAMSFAA